MTKDNKKGNVFFSPLSISAAMSMVYLGAKGNTADQIAKALHFDTVGDVHASFQALNAVINKPSSSYEMKLANCLFGEKSFSFLQEFLEQTKKFYEAELSPEDFLNNPEKARNKINAWVQNQTEGKIQDLLAPNTVDSFTKLVLVNAIYFKGTWSKKFEGYNTRDCPFRMTKDETIMVKMMYRESNFRYNHISELHLSILELPYQQDKASMVILLPDNFTDDSTGLDELQKKLSYEKLAQWTDPTNMQTTIVRVYLPKFGLRESYDMNSLMNKMGIIDAFTDSADFSGMTGKKEIKISTAVHKSFVDVNEQGTEAAAATGVTFAVTSAMIPKEYKVFKADHPFVFFIKDNTTKSILFTGRLCHP